MAVSITNISESAVYSGQPVEIQVTYTNSGGATATISDILLQAPAGSVCTLTRNGDIPTTLADAGVLVVPFMATFYASVNLYPATKVYQSFSVTAIVKATVSGSYSETASSAVTINAINPSFPSAAQIQGPTSEVGALNLTSKKRSFMLPYLF